MKNGKKKDKTEKPEPVEIMPPIEDEPVNIMPPVEEPVQIASKQFVKKLQEELKGTIPASVFLAFVSVVPPVSTEENYRKIWKETFKRQ